MATQAYYDWINAGRLWHKATPVAEYQAALIKAGWPSWSLGTIGDGAHLTADRPQDHTPFAVTGWPGTHPYPYVLALDAGHLPDRGLDVAPVVAHWLDDARAGKTPWVKYIVWRGAISDVRSGWEPRSASGHYDHAHVSFRTDWYDKSIGAYSVIGGGTPVGTTTTGRAVWDETIDSPSEGFSGPAREWIKYVHTVHRQVSSLQTAVEALSAAVGELSARPGTQVDPQALADALAANEGFVNVISSTIAARLGMIPTAGEIARAIGELRFQVRAE